MNKLEKIEQQLFKDARVSGDIKQLKGFGDLDTDLTQRQVWFLELKDLELSSEFFDNFKVGDRTRFENGVYYIFAKFKKPTCYGCFAPYAKTIARFDCYGGYYPFSFDSFVNLREYDHALKFLKNQKNPLTAKLTKEEDFKCGEIIKLIYGSPRMCGKIKKRRGGFKNDN